MDDRKFDALTCFLGRATSRRSAILGLLGLTVGGVWSLAVTGADAARRPPRENRVPSCPGQQTWVDGQCVCPEGNTICGSDCCPGDVAECCDGACCYGTCYGEELCCPAPREWCSNSETCCPEGLTCSDELGCVEPVFCDEGRTLINDGCFVPCQLALDCVDLGAKVYCRERAEGGQFCIPFIEHDCEMTLSCAECLTDADCPSGMMCELFVWGETGQPDKMLYTCESPA